jgi:hypothetical protein
MTVCAWVGVSLFCSLLVRYWYRPGRAGADLRALSAGPAAASRPVGGTLAPLAGFLVAVRPRCCRRCAARGMGASRGRTRRDRLRRRIRADRYGTGLPRRPGRTAATPGDRLRPGTLRVTSCGNALATPLRRPLPVTPRRPCDRPDVVPGDQVRHRPEHDIDASHHDHAGDRQQAEPAEESAPGNLSQHHSQDGTAAVAQASYHHVADSADNPMTQEH